MPYTTLLRDVFGFDAFRPGQEEIVRAVTEGQNVLAIMPTGGGKSLCFQLPALMRIKFSTLYRANDAQINLGFYLSSLIPVS